jgi:hypothetical protein
MTTVSEFDLLISLRTGCLANFQASSDLLFQLFYPSIKPSSTSSVLTPTNKQLMNYLKAKYSKSIRAEPEENLMFI